MNMLITWCSMSFRTKHVWKNPTEKPGGSAAWNWGSFQKSFLVINIVIRTGHSYFFQLMASSRPRRPRQNIPAEIAFVILPLGKD